MASQADERLEAGRVAVRFARHGDRVAHEVLLLDGGRWNCVLQSIEGTANEPWPASPPLQSLHVEQRPGGTPVALLVGMAGKSHWSVSIELDANKGVARFDVACRVRGDTRGTLSSRYRLSAESLADGVVAESDVAIASHAATPAIGWRLRLDERFPGARLSATRCGILAIVPECPAAAEGAHTVRWGYTIGPRL